MRKKRRPCLRLSLLAILTLSTLFFSANSCRTKEIVFVPIGDAKVVSKLPNGNFEVTPAFLMKFNEYRSQVELLTLELKKCQEEKAKD